MELVSTELSLRTNPRVPHGTARGRAPSKGLLILLVLPVMAYVAVMVLSVWRRHPLIFVFSDLVLLILALTYCCVGTWLACRRSAFLVRFVACLYSVLVGGAVVETAVRVVRPPLENVPMPRMRAVYFPSAHMPGVTGPIEFTANDLGLRGPAVHLEDVETRILCVGGSTTECMYVTDKLSWPWLLQDMLSRRTGKSVFVGNAGRSGQITLNHDFLLKEYPLARRFEWVLLLCGVNDMVALLCNRNYEDHKARVQTLTLHNPSSNQHRAYYCDLAFVQTLKDTLVSPPRPPGIRQDTAGLWIEAERSKRQAALKARPITQVPREDLEKALRTYRENLNAIITTCDRQKQRLVLMTQPAIYRPDLPEELERLTWMSNNTAYTSAVLAQLMAAFNQATIDVGNERGIDTIDAAARLPKDTTVFFDDVHFNVGGSEQLAALVADYFVAKLK